MKTIQLLLKILTFLNKKLALHFTRFLASFPRQLATKQRDLDFIASAQKIEFNHKGKKIALSWGQGPVVILVHGWEGRSTQMAPMAKALANQGFQAIALDYTGHGLSQGRQSGFNEFIDDLAALHQHVVNRISPNIEAMVGHSAGGLCMMASRLFNDFTVNKYVVLCAPSAPYPAVASLRKALKVSEEVLSLVQDDIAKCFKTDWQTLLDGMAYNKRFDDEKLLLIYDQDDTMVDHNEAQKIQRIFHGANTFKTQGNGHIKLLWDEAVIHQVCDFVSSTERGNTTSVSKG